MAMKKAAKKSVKRATRGDHHDLGTAGVGQQDAPELTIEEKFEKLVEILKRHGIHFDATEESEMEDADGEETEDAE